MSTPSISPRITNAIAVVVTIVWAVSFGADIILADYDPSPFVHLVMMAVVGAAFGTNLLKKSEEQK